VTDYFNATYHLDVEYSIKGVNEFFNVGALALQLLPVSIAAHWFFAYTLTLVGKLLLQEIITIIPQVHS
jgi:hypothetical protein